MRSAGRSLVAVLALASTLLLSGRALAAFHIAVIDEVQSSYGGDPTQQFVEIRMLLGGQNLVMNSVLAAFDASGAYVGDILVVPGNVANSGAGVRWIMATSAFQTAHGVTADFTMPPGILLGGGMICWGAPGSTVPPSPGSWDHTMPTNYVDCLAYGTYSGPTNPHIGTPTPLTPEGHSLRRQSETMNNMADFVCSDPSTPTNNAGTTVNVPEPVDRQSTGSAPGCIERVVTSTRDATMNAA